MILPDIPGRGFPLAHRALPGYVAGRAFGVVEVAREGEGEPLVEAALVEEVGFFEGGQVAGDDGGAGEEDGGADAVRAGDGDWRNWGE